MSCQDAIDARTHINTAREALKRTLACAPREVSRQIAEALDYTAQAASVIFDIAGRVERGIAAAKQRGYSRKSIKTEAAK